MTMKLLGEASKKGNDMHCSVFLNAGATAQKDAFVVNAVKCTGNQCVPVKRVSGVDVTYLLQLNDDMVNKGYTWSPDLKESLKKLVEGTAVQVKKQLSPFSSRIEIAGSIRRKKPYPADIDIVLVPSDITGLKSAIKKLGIWLRGAEIRQFTLVNGVQVDIYIAKREYWGAALMRSTGPNGYNIGLSKKVAVEHGWKLSEYGLRDEHGDIIAGETEESIYEAIGKPYKKPELRGK